MGKKISLTITETLGLKDSVNWERRREFFEENPKIKWLIRAITVGSPFLGLVFLGFVGLVLGLILRILSYWLGPYAVTKVREIERGSA